MGCFVWGALRVLSLGGLCCRHFHGSLEWRRGGSAAGLCMRGVLDETDLKTIKNEKFASHSNHYL